MGNASSITKNEEMEEEENRNSNSVDLDCDEFMESIPKQMAHSSPLSFTPQIPVAPLEKIDEMTSKGNIWTNTNSLPDENNLVEEGIPTMITWSHGGTNVFIQGSWDNWKTRKQLQRFGEEFYFMKVLPLGYYQYKFLVNGKWSYSPDLPSVRDEIGEIYNLLRVQESAQENIESISHFNAPQSPESSYNNCPLNSEEFTKEPPVMPPQLNLTLLNVPNGMHREPCQMRGPHVILNHLYIKRGQCDHSVVAIGETCRFLAKHVTVVLYKSLHG